MACQTRSAHVQAYKTLPVRLVCILLNIVTIILVAHSYGKYCSSYSILTRYNLGRGFKAPSLRNFATLAFNFDVTLLGTISQKIFLHGVAKKIDYGSK